MFCFCFQVLEGLIPNLPQSLECLASGGHSTLADTKVMKYYIVITITIINIIVILTIIIIIIIIINTIVIITITVDSLLTDTSLKRTPGVCPCLSLLPLFDSIRWTSL